MAQVYFDTLKFVETHEAVDVATKRDLEELRKEMQNEFAKVDSKIDKVSLQLTVKFGGMLVIAVGVLAAIIKLPL